ncbi:UDP-glucose 4-epimerase family protein [Halopseudomonas formosensis]|uniref:SDR family oxidoreductase n=1 Tax=Halopseudomonas formosensis TaxID=1002526 RepID=A0ABU5BXM4_9GAMM|nr:SDR family oxidoreductase [Halopseudomonas formosensis]MDX9687533.1 SDR family oxidoreductase [Halopseudomonas formosensis]
MNGKILLTGANGFVGRAVLDRLVQIGHPVKAAVRSSGAELGSQVKRIVISGLDANTDWSLALEDIVAVIHSAARVHVMNDQTPDPLAEFRKVNVDGTLHLARQAALAGVKRFIFISSIKVNGEGTRPGLPYTAFDAPDPQDPYGVSKMEAEEGLRRIAQDTGMELVIIRPVLVYGPGVKANFRSMMSWVNRGIPLPLGAIHNKRSLVSLDNLVDLIVTCIDHPRAANQTFLVSDGEDLSTSEMLRKMAAALGRPARLLPVPATVLEGAAGLLGKRGVAQRLCGSLQVDIGHTRETLGWSPPVSVDQGFRAAASAYLNE